MKNPNPIQLTAEEVESLIADVEREIADSLGKSEPRLAKADDGDDKPADKDAASPSPAGPPPADASASPSAPPPGPDAGPPPASPEPSPDASASPESAAPADMGALKAAYAELPPDQLEMHYLAVKAALAEKMGGQSPSIEAGAPPGAGSPPAASPSPAGPPTEKNEIAPSPGNGGKAMEKSEVATPEVVELRKHVDVLTRAVELLATPQRKAVTSVAFLSKGEEQKPKIDSLTKGEIKARLADKIRTSFGTLSKSDKDAIRAYEVGETTADKIAHLLA